MRIDQSVSIQELQVAAVKVVKFSQLLHISIPHPPSYTSLANEREAAGIKNQPSTCVQELRQYLSFMYSRGQKTTFTPQSIRSDNDALKVLQFIKPRLRGDTLSQH